MQSATPNFAGSQSDKPWYGVKTLKSLVSYPGYQLVLIKQAPCPRLRIESFVLSAQTPLNQMKSVKAAGCSAICSTMTNLRTVSMEDTRP